MLKLIPSINRLFLNKSYKFCAPSSKLISIQSEDDWEQHILSQSQPVILDFYADWCGPCKKLYPIMTSMMDQNSSFVLAKVNIDEMGEVASAMGVQSIPHVFLIHKAEVLDSFVGIPQQDKLKAFFEKAQKAGSGIENESDTVNENQKDKKQ